MTHRARPRQDLTENSNPNKGQKVTAMRAAGIENRKELKLAAMGTRQTTVTKETINDKTKHRSGAINTRN